MEEGGYGKGDEAMEEMEEGGNGEEEEATEEHIREDKDGVKEKVEKRDRVVVADEEEEVAMEAEGAEEVEEVAMEAEEVWLEERVDGVNCGENMDGKNVFLVDEETSV